MAGRKRRAECEYGEAAEEAHHRIHHKQPCTVYEEVESSYNHGYEYVAEHRVKTEFTPLIRAIFKKYGDITIGNDVKSSNLLCIFLERICHVYQRLEPADCLDLTRVELQGMISEIRLFKRHKLDVEWILERVEYKLIEFMNKELGGYEAQVCSLQKKISSIKAELIVMKQEVAAAADIKAGVIALDEEQVGAGEEVRGEVRSAVRRSTRLRKQPGWHEAFCLLDSGDLW
ncbi:hypothetical protein AAHA92_04367 [Salvia divinorum]|uniref:Uncharacterized protein n=1 Tax=Salvia divinorum TaxID=28513 RepID=A0ABD1HYY2_SALDI